MNLTIPVYYENSNGDIVQLNDGTCFVNADDLRDFEWDCDVIGRPSGLGGYVRKISRHQAKKHLTIAVRGKDFLERINTLHAVSEYDVLSNSPGKLWVGGAYLPCYLGIESEVTRYSKRVGYAEKEITVLSVAPFWHTEVTKTFSPSAGAISGGKKYNLRYPYRFWTGYSSDTLYNTHFADTPARITFYGAVNNPTVTIAGNVYALSATLIAGERVDVDQLEHTIIKTGTSGEKTSVFNSRDKTNDIFKPIPPGSSAVQHESLTFSVTLVQRRSELLWT